MTKADTYDIKGKKSGSIDLPDNIFGLPWNDSLVHQVVVGMQANARTPVAHTKDRGDVKGGGRKPWKQKGTGRARHGSIRSPLWKGGGVTFGPRNDTKFGKSINKKMRAKALFTTLSRKLKDGKIIFVDEISFSKPNTSEAKKVLIALSSVKGFEGMDAKKRNSVFVATEGNDKIIAKSFSNFGNVEVDDIKNLNPVDVLQYKYLVVMSPKDAISGLQKRAKTVLGAKNGKKVAESGDKKEKVVAKPARTETKRSRGKTSTKKSSAKSVKTTKTVKALKKRGGIK
jgi:large subunit ribosomal protein L4